MHLGNNWISVELLSALPIGFSENRIGIKPSHVFSPRLNGGWASAINTVTAVSQIAERSRAEIASAIFCNQLNLELKCVRFVIKTA